MICELDKAEGEVCPLCKRKLEDDQIELFKQYHDIITGQLEAEINTLNIEINKVCEQVNRIKAINISSWSNLTTIDSNLILDLITSARAVIDSCGLDVEPTSEAKSALTIICEHVDSINELLLSKQQAIEMNKTGRDTVMQSLEKLKSEIQPLKYQEALSKNIDKLRKALQMFEKEKIFNDTLSGFPPLFTRITNTAKQAYEHLVVNDFESRLNQEYRNLTEKDMNAFGVMLKKAGADATVTVTPLVSGKSIEDVLSEGELRMHALSLFFAELECLCCPVLVFDDPVSSFDYNYIENFCIRLRDFAFAHPDCQIIALTHNWEYFVQLQTTLNSANARGLNNRFSVHVLENCHTIAEYSENVDTLKTDVSTILSLVNEPTKKQKEEMAGKMRRLIETVVNTHVFNGQRHQYKQKSQPVSVFQKYVKVEPLMQSEATELADLFSKLSVSEHDDPRNAYVNTDKAAFQTRFDKICAIEAAILSRK
jgi:wobble nucleotide-excising tRNase